MKGSNHPMCFPFLSYSIILKGTITFYNKRINHTFTAIDTVKFAPSTVISALTSCLGNDGKTVWKPHKQNDSVTVVHLFIQLHFNMNKSLVDNAYTV